MCSELNQSFNTAKLLALQQYALPNICICVVPHASLFAMFYWCSAKELNSMDAGKEMEGDAQPWRGAAAAQDCMMWWLSFFVAGVIGTWMSYVM